MKMQVQKHNSEKQKNKQKPLKSLKKEKGIIVCQNKATKEIKKEYEEESFILNTSSE